MAFDIVFSAFVALANLRYINALNNNNNNILYVVVILEHWCGVATFAVVF